MKLMFLLSKENIELAKEEVIAVAKPKDNKYELDENILILDSDVERMYKRLAFTHKIYEFLFSCKEKDLDKCMQEFKWKNVYRDSFVVRTIGKFKQSESELAGYVWDCITCPKVSLKYAMTKIELVKTKKMVYCGLIDREIKKEFYKRKAHLRPELHPTSLNPKLARAMINLTGIEKGTIVDPFCGTGGLMLEAGKMNFKTIGYDISQEMLDKCQANLDHYHLKYYTLEQQDALKLRKKLDYVATDLPYGRNSKLSIKLEDLYKGFFKVLDEHLANKAVIGMPSDIDVKKMVKGYKRLIVINEFEFYIHKSLIKKIVVIGKA